MHQLSYRKQGPHFAGTFPPRKLPETSTRHFSLTSAASWRTSDIKLRSATNPGPAASHWFFRLATTIWWYLCAHMGMSENGVYPQWNSHLVGIMISKTIGFRGTIFSDKPISRHISYASMKNWRNWTSNKIWTIHIDEELESGQLAHSLASLVMSTPD